MGDNYVSRWAKKTSAKGAVTLTDDCLVSVSRSDGTCTRFRESANAKNDKEVNGYDLNGDRFTAIGVGVPDAVSKWFNWSEVNVQKQHDQAFLISKGSGEVAAFLNRTVHLDDIDSHISAAASLLRSEKSLFLGLQESQEQDSKALGALGWVDLASARLEALEALDKERVALSDVATRLRNLAIQMEAAERRIAEASKVLTLEPRIKDLRRQYDWCRGLMEQGHGIRDIVQRWAKASQDIERSGQLAALEPRAEALRTLESQALASTVQWDSLSRVCQSWESSDRALQKSGKLVALVPRLQGVQELASQVKDAQGKAESLHMLVFRWEQAKRGFREVDWDSLESRMRRVRALGRGIHAREQEAESLHKFSLTFTELETSIQDTGKRVSELESMLPESCPLCGGTLHKGQTHHG